MYSTSYSARPYYSSSYNYPSPQSSPAFSPRYTIYTATPSAKVHTRRGTEDLRGSHAKPQKTSYHNASYGSAERDAPRRSSSRREAEHASAFVRTHSGKGGTTRRYTVNAAEAGGFYRTTQSKDPYVSSRYASNDVYADYNKEDYLSAYERKYRYSPPPQEERRYSTRDHAYRDQPYRRSYQHESPSTHRPRRTSNATKPQPTPPSSPRQATDADARRAGIPAGFSTKHWDPAEDPILLLGSVFDANSLGKWIYDWTVACRGPGTPISEVAGDLWLLLIQLSGKLKRAERCRPRVRRADDRELISDFVESGDRLWTRFNKLLKICESYMLKAAKREKVGGSMGRKKVVAGKNSGREFVDCIFGRDRELERTEKLMTGIRLWSMRFDANCEYILRNPDA